MTRTWNERAGRNRPTVGRRGDEADLGHDGVRHIAKVHHRPSGEANALETRLQANVGVQLSHAFVAGDADSGRRDDNHRHAVVDARDLDLVDLVTNMSGWQERAARRACGVLEIHLDRCAGPRHAVDPRLAVVGDLPARCFDDQIGDRAGVERPYPDVRRAILRRHEPTLNRERADASQDVAAIRRGIHDGSDRR